MKTHALVCGLLLLSVHTAAVAQKNTGQLPSPSAQATPPALARCDAEATQYFDAAYLSARDSVAKGQIKSLDYGSIVTRREGIQRSCLHKIDGSSFSSADVLTLAKAFVQARDHDAAMQMIRRLAATPGIGDSLRAEALLAMVQQYAMSPITHLSYAEPYADELDASAGAGTRTKLAAHEQLFRRYQDADRDLGSQKHAVAIIKLARSLRAHVRTQERPNVATDEIDASQLLLMYQTAANVDGNFGKEDAALKLLVEARTDHPEIPAAILDSGLSATIGRLKLTGQSASSFAPETWFNAPRGMRTPEFQGNVTVLNFTAHWCPPCHATYQPLQAISDSLGSRGVRVLFVTTYYGFVGAKRNLTAQQEREATRAYYEARKISFPIALVGAGFDSVKFAQRISPPPYASYHVEQIPQTVVIDRRGKIRRTIVGWDPANAERLPALLRTLLDEK